MSSISHNLGQIYINPLHVDIMTTLRILSKNFQKLFFIFINRICRNKLLKLSMFECTRYCQITLKFILTVLEEMCGSMCFYSLSR